MVEACDTSPADQCCGVLPCTLCLEWDSYADGTSYGTANFMGSTWEGSVGGHSFLSYWEVPTLPDFYPTPELGSNSIGMSFSALVEATYTMGSPVDEPGREANETQHAESVEAFNIAKSVVSQDQYYAVMGTNPSHFLNPKNTAVEMVSWDDAYAFCIRLNKLPAEVAMGRTYRLPTEAEWEYACRSGATGAYFFGADPANLPTYGWFATNSAGETQELQAKVPNSAGLFDTHGNVWEWTTEANESNGIVRGGAWDSTAAQCRSASRRVVDPTTKANNIGFRVVMVQGPPLPIPQFGECEYVVFVDGEEVLRETCYEGASCRYPGGSVSVISGYDEGTLTWTKYDPRPLPLTVDPDTGCNDFFCGTCRCTCRALCVEVSEVLFYNGIAYATDTYSGELGDTAYSDCEQPVWEGTIGSFTIRLALDRDDYGNCIMRATANGEEATTSIADCENLSGTIELYDGSSFTFSCKGCNECTTVVGDCICGRSLGPTLRLVWSSGNLPVGEGGEFELNYGMHNEPQITCLPWSPGPFPGWRGSQTGNFPLPQGGSKPNSLEVLLPCGCINCGNCIYYRWGAGAEPTQWVQSSYEIITCDCPAILDAHDMEVNDGWGHQVDAIIYELASNC